MYIRGNSIVIYGGGLADPAKDVMVRIGKELWESKVYDKVYFGKYSFLSLSDSSLWLEYNGRAFDEFISNKRGTYFGTCRGVDMTEPQVKFKAFEVLKKHNIKTVIVCGGDGSSRNCAEMEEEFKQNGINVIFAIPLTVDGINGGRSIGIDQAVRESIRQTENVAATSLETKDNGEYSVVTVELQGRNRDDILANVVKTLYRNKKVADCSLDDILLRVVPANYETNEDELIEEINSSKLRTLLLISEGAKNKTEIVKKITRKVRSVCVGHATQSNNLTTDEDMERYSNWLSDIARIISRDPYDSYSIVNDGISRFKASLNYYARKNPRENQIATISSGLEAILKLFMV